MEAQKDCLVRAISKDGFVNAVAVYTRGLTERARQIHHTSPVATAALGRALAACSMMGNALKDNGASVTMQIKGDGPLGTILTVSDSEGNVRGYVQNPAVDLALREDGKLDVGTAVGHSGTLTVIKDLNMREPYVGTVDLLGGEIAEDVAGYFVESEQIPTACALGVLVDVDQSVQCAGGYLIQLLPGAGEDTIAKVEGGITRLCAVFRDADTIPEVGPLRSGRDQFLQLLMPHQALYYHDGESIFCTQFINVYDYSGLNIGGKSYFNTPVHPHVAHRDNRGRNVAYEHTEFTSGKEIKQAAGNAGIGLTYANETPFFHFADYRTAASNDLPGAPAAKTISITHSESYRTRLSYNSWGRSYKLEMYNRSKKAYENTVDELTGKQLTFDNVVVCFADIAAYAGDSHDVQSVNYVAGGQAYLFTRGGVQVGRWEKPHPTHPLKLYTETGEEMTLNRGKTYLALVDNDEWSNFSY